MPGNYTFTAADAGAHTFTNGVTLKTAGTQSITVTDTGTGTITGTQSVTVSPAGAATYTVAGFTSPTSAGVAHSVTVTALDAFGNTATGYRGTVHFTSSDAQAGLPANYAFTAGDAGVHTFTNGVTLKTAGTQSITATDTVTGTITGTQSGITVLPSTTTVLAVSGYPNPTTAGVAHNVTVSAEDAFGNVTPSYTGTVHFTSTDAQAVLPANYAFTAGDAGTHTFTNGVTLKTAGTRSITATDTVTGSITGTQSVTVNAAGASSMTASGYPSPTTAGAAHSVTLTVFDAFGNPASGYTGTVHFTSTDSQATLPANYTFTGADAGTHTFTNAVTLKTVGTQSITATDTVTGSITGTQSGITVNVGPTSQLVVSGYPEPDHGGDGGQRDGDGRGRLRQHDHGLHAARSTSRAATPRRCSRPTTPSRPGTPGSTPSSATLKTAGNQSITATDTVTGTITGAQTAITVNPGSATTLAVSGLPEPDDGWSGPQRHGDGPRRLRQHGDRLPGHGPLHQHRRPGHRAGELHLHRR